MCLSGAVSGEGSFFCDFLRRLCDVLSDMKDVRRPLLTPRFQPPCAGVVSAPASLSLGDAASDPEGDSPISPSSKSSAGVLEAASAFSTRAFLAPDASDSSSAGLLRLDGEPGALIVGWEYRYVITELETE